MSRKHFSTLLIALIAVIAAIALLVPGKTGREGQPETGLLLPDVGERINRAERVQVTVAGGEVTATLERGDVTWSIAELHGYPADWEKLRELLRGLARAKVVELKTANPEYYSRLGVADVSSEDASGVQVTVLLPDEEIRVILGDDAASRTGRYARLADQERSVLIDLDVSIAREAIGWADDTVVDIPADEVAEVEVTHADGEAVRVRKVSADDTDFELQNMPEGREPASAWTVNSLGGVLAALRMEDVRPAADLDWSEATRLRVLTFSGLEVTAALAQVEPQTIEGDGEEDEPDPEAWLRLAASVPAAAESAPAPGQDGEAAGGSAEIPGEAAPEQADQGGEAAGSTVDPDTGEGAGADGADASERAGAINARVQGWAYRLPSYKADAMVKRMEDLLKAPAEEDDT